MSQTENPYSKINIYGSFKNLSISVTIIGNFKVVVNLNSKGRTSRKIVINKKTGNSLCPISTISSVFLNIKYNIINSKLLKNIVIIKEENEKCSMLYPPAIWKELYNC